MRYAAAFRHSDSIVALLSVDDGSFMDVNPAFERVLGWSRDEVIGRRPLDLDLWPDFEVRSEIWGQIRAFGQVRDIEARVRAKSGSILTATLDCELVDAGQGVAVFCLLRETRAQHDATLDAREAPQS